MKDTDFLLIQGNIRTRLHLRGASCDLFSLIYNVSKDGVHTYHASLDMMAEWLDVSERQVKDIIKVLLESGYINRVGQRATKFSNHKTYEYTTNYEELLRRSYAGEDIRPLPMKRRASGKPVADKKGGESSPFVKNDGKGGESSPERVVKVPEKGGESSPTNKGLESITKDSTSTREARAYEKAEEKIFYKILFFRNAADPAAEVERMVGCFTSMGWKSKDGMVVYDTPAKRAGLAYGWFVNGNGRLPMSTAKEERQTKKFYAFLESLYDMATERGGIDPALVIDKRSRYKVEGGNVVTVYVHKAVSDWFEAQPDAGAIINQTMGPIRLFYEYIS